MGSRLRESDGVAKPQVRDREVRNYEEKTRGGRSSREGGGVGRKTGRAGTVASEALDGTDWKTR